MMHSVKIDNSKADKLLAELKKHSKRPMGQQPIRLNYKSCKGCGAPSTDDWECEYCGRKYGT